MIDKLYEYALENAGNTVEITQVQSAKNESIKFFGIIDLLRYGSFNLLPVSKNPIYLSLILFFKIISTLS